MIPEVHLYRAAMSTEMAAPSQTLPGFLRLAVELRNQIYRHLLVVDRWQIQNDTYGWDLTPSVLRVSHQIHDEAIDVLHWENDWILLENDEETFRQLNPEINGRDIGDRRHGPVLAARNFPAFLQILTCDTPGKFLAPKKVRHREIRPLEALPDCCYRLTRSSLTDPYDTRGISINFDNHCKMTEIKRRWIMNCLGNVYGRRMVLIRGFLVSMVEATEARMQRSLTYESLAGEFSSYLDGPPDIVAGFESRCSQMELYKFLTNTQATLQANDAMRASLTETGFLRRVRVEITNSIALCCLEAGEPDSALKFLREVLITTPSYPSLSSKYHPWLRCQQRWRMYDNIAGACMAKKAFNAALYATFEQLTAFPQSSHARKRVEDIRLAIQANPLPHYGMVQANIENVVQPMMQAESPEEDEDIIGDEARRLRSIYAGTSAEMVALEYSKKVCNEPSPRI